jgi:hypothetical protein
MVKDLNDRGIKASLMPNNDFAQELVPRYPRKYLTMVGNIYREIN